MGAGHNRLVLYSTTGARGCAPPGPGTRCRGTSTRPTGAPAATPSTRSGARATSSAEHAAPARAGGSRGVSARDASSSAAGPNGLAAAIRLAEAGRAVLVLEAADAPGGAVRTEELTLPGFRHDTFSSVYPAAVASPVFARMPLERHGLRWVHPAACYAHPLPDGARRRALPRRRRDGGERSTPSRRRRRALARVRRAATRALRRACARTMLSGFPPVGGPLQLLAGAGPAAPLELRAAAARLRASALGRRLFDDRRSRAWLYGAAMHGDAPPDGAGSAIAAVYLNLLGHAVGWPSPRGGAERLTDALVGYLRALGGEVRTGARVERVARRRRPRHRRRSSPAASASTRRLVDRRRDAARAAAAGRRRLPRLVPRPRCAATATGPATLKVDWALDGPIPWANAEPSRGAGTVHVGGGEDEILAPIAQAARRPARAPVPAARPAERRRPDARARRASTPPGPTRTARAGRRLGGEPTRHVERIEAQVERFAPGLPRPHPRPPRARPRPTSRRRNANLVGGDVGGGSYRARPGRLPPAPVALALPHAAARPVPRQRRDVPRRRRPRRARRRRRARARLKAHLKHGAVC